MKKITFLLTIAAVVWVMGVQAQVIISSNTSDTPDASSALEIRATDGGVLIPRMTQAQRNAITSPATGLLIYQTDNTPSFYYYNGTAWIRIGRSGDDWSLTGNAGTTVGTNFIGTTDAVDFATYTNNTERMRVESDGQIVIGNGYAAPVAADKFVVRGNTTNWSAINGYSNVSGGIGVYGSDGGGGIGVYGSDGGGGIGVYGSVDNTDGIGVWANNDDADGWGMLSAGSGVGAVTLINHSAGISSTGNDGIYTSAESSTGTGIIATGNNSSAANILTNGSGAAFTGTNVGVYTKSTNSSGTGIIGVGNNQSPASITGGCGVSGIGSEYGVFGNANSSTGAGILGLNSNANGWAGDFQGNFKMGYTTSNVHNFWGDFQSGSASDNHRIIPNTGDYGYVGTGTLYWYYMYSNNYINVSSRDIKRDITPFDDITSNIIMRDIENMKPSFYKYKLETDQMEPGNEAKYRPNAHLGLIVDESPDYIQDNTFSGIDIYALGTLALAGVKYNREDIKKIQEKISDFGSAQMQGTEIWVGFDTDFSSKLSGNNMPVITVTSNNPDVTLSISQKTLNGFKVVTSKAVSGLSFDWIAMAKVDPDQGKPSEEEINTYKRQNQLLVSDDVKQQMRNWAKQENERLDAINEARKTSEKKTEKISIEESKSGKKKLESLKIKEQNPSKEEGLNIDKGKTETKNTN